MALIEVISEYAANTASLKVGSDMLLCVQCVFIVCSWDVTKKTHNIQVSMGASGSRAPACSCDLSLVIFSAKELEQVLEQHFEGTGKGLHEKISSATGLSEDLKRRLRRIATIRNKLVHEVGFDHIPDRTRFKAEFESSKAELLKIVKARNVVKDNGSTCIIM